MKLSSIEKLIFNYLTTEDISDKSAEEIANILFVSRASIYRVCKKMGYNSFSQFKYLFANGGNELKKVDTKAVFDFVDDSQMAEILKQIKVAEQVYVFATYATSMISSYFVRQLVNLGYNAILISDSFELESRSKLFTNKDCVICLSNSGMLLSIDLEQLENLSSIIISITETGSKLADISNYSILFNFPVYKDGAAFDRENLFNLMVIVEKLLINLRVKK